MKKSYLQPTVSIEVFNQVDIICTSGGDDFGSFNKDWLGNEGA